MVNLWHEGGVHILVVTILQYVSVSIGHIVHVIFIQCYMLIIYHYVGKNKKERKLRSGAGAVGYSPAKYLRGLPFPPGYS